MYLKLRQSVLLACLAVTVATSSGCFALLLGAAAGAAGVVYVKGDLEKNFDEDMERLHKATVAGLKSMDIFILSETVNQHDITVVGEYEGGEKVNVAIKALTEKTSKVRLRVGVIGDEAKSLEIMNAIEKKL